jgi:hypothetical protein
LSENKIKSLDLGKRDMKFIISTFFSRHLKRNIKILNGAHRELKNVLYSESKCFTLKNFVNLNFSNAMTKYFNEAYNFIGCKLDDGIYLCPCARNKKIVLNTTIEEKHKVLVEYYINKYGDATNRITNEYWLTPSDADEQEIKDKIKLERRYFIIIILSILSIVGLIVFVLFILFKKWYNKLMSED